MMKTNRALSTILVFLVLLVSLCGSTLTHSQTKSRKAGGTSGLTVRNNAGFFDVKSFGAKGDGKAVDSPAINRAIDAAAATGGGTVFFSAGTYRCFSIHLKSNVALYLDQGATILAADPSDKDGQYDPPEPNQWEQFQDFGHSHWRNSLIWGENLENISILGPGRIWGKGLVRSGSQSRTKEQNDALGNTPPDPRAGPFGYPNPRDAVEPGWGNKSISLKLCRNVIIRDITIFHGGHFAILATGVDNLTIDNLKIDTNRDGIDADACKNVRISNCVFDYSRGLALEAVDGALLEDVTISNITMRDISNSPIFIRLGFRGRGPKDKTTVGALRRVLLSNIVVYNADPKYSSIISGIPGHPIEDVRLSNIRIYSQGGGTKEHAALDPPEKEDGYPEPNMFGELPAYGFFIRHVKGLQMNDVEVSYIRDDARPAFVMNDV